MDVGNPFAFCHIHNLKSIDVNAFDECGPSVVFASPGMFQSGVSRQLFDRWATDPKNVFLKLRVMLLKILSPKKL